MPPRKILLFICLAFSYYTASAQLLFKNKRPELLISSGIGAAFSAGPFNEVHLNLEMVQSPYLNIGLSVHNFLPETGNYNFYFPSPTTSFYADLSDGGFLGGIYARYFIHGRLTGRKSGLYIGTAVRAGIYRVVIRDYSFSGAPTTMIPAKIPTYFALVDLGWQFKFGKYILLDLQLPVGYQSMKLPRIGADRQLLDSRTVDNFITFFPGFNMGVRIPGKQRK